VKLRAQFDNKDGALFPNQFVNIRLLVQLLKNQVIIPMRRLIAARPRVVTPRLRRKHRWHGVGAGPWS